MLFVLALLAGEYYYTMHPQSAAEKAAVELADKEAAMAKAAAEAGTTSPTPSEPAPPQAVPGGATNAATGKMNAKLGGIGSKLERTAYKVGDKVYAPYGVYLRCVLIACALIMAFVMKPSVPRPGQPKRKKPEKKVVKTIVIGSAVLGAAASYLLLTVTAHPLPFIEIWYPVSGGVVLLCGFMAGGMLATQKRIPGMLNADRKPKITQYGVVLQTEDGGFVSVPNPFRGTIVLGGAGAGKTYSVGEPFMEQFAEKQFAGLVYDFKFPVLAEALQKSVELARQKALASGKPFRQMKYHVINFKDMERTHKVNPLEASMMPEVSYALEYARTILNNLNPGSIKNRGFFEISSEAYLTAIIWFYRRNYPQFCTIPHVVNTALYSDFTNVLAMLENDPESADQARSLITALEQKAEKQIAGVVASLQIALTRINTPQIVWVLSPDKEKGEGFNLTLNDAENPALLCVGNDPTLQETFGPVVAVIIAVAIKLMNQQKRHPSYVFLDEAATIYVPNLETLPATARSNKVALIYMTQDLSQMIDAYGRDKMNVMVSNLNNQFFGKVNSVETAKFISDLVGREDREMYSVSSGQSKGGKGGGSSKNTSASYQERSLIKQQDPINLDQGEFIIQTVETDTNFVKTKIVRKVQPGNFPLNAIATFSLGEAVLPTAASPKQASTPNPEGLSWVAKRQLMTQQPVKHSSEGPMEAIVRANFEMVRQEVATIIKQYPNRFAKPEALEELLSR